MIRIINNTDIHESRLLVLYAPELSKVKTNNIECIVFDTCSMAVWGIDTLLLDSKLILEINE